MSQADSSRHGEPAYVGLGKYKLGNYCRRMQDPHPDRNFGFLVHDVARLMRVAYDRRTRELGLTRSQWWVLNNLYFNEGITQSELADLLDIEKPTLGRLLDRLEDKGWLERRGDPSDRRAKRVYLTGNVQGLMRTLRRLAADLRASALAGLDESEREQLLEALRVIKGNLLRLNGNGGFGESKTRPGEGTDAGRDASAG
jgi:MarR family transcriptional regulator, transcriptional regulator for hemolysin